MDQLCRQFGWWGYNPVRPGPVPTSALGWGSGWGCSFYRHTPSPELDPDHFPLRPLCTETQEGEPRAGHTLTSATKAPEWYGTGVWGPAFSLSSLAVENPSCPSVESQVTMLGADVWLIFLYKVQCFLNDLQWEMDLSVTRKLGNNHHHLLSSKYTLWACAHHSRQITIGNSGNSQAGTFFFSYFTEEKAET